MTSLDTYTDVNVVVPAVLSGVLWALIFFPLLFVLCLVDDVPRFFVEMLQLSMSDIEESGGSCVKVDGCKIKKNFLKLLLLLVIPLTVTTIFFSFWNVWLVQEEPAGGCLPNFDCFPILGDTVLQDTPVETCSQSFNLSTAVVDLMNDTSIYADTAAEGELAPDAVTYKCYRFVFRYAEGIGAAGGILLFTAILSKLYVSIFVSIYNMDNAAVARGCTYDWFVDCYTGSVAPVHFGQYNCSNSARGSVPNRNGRHTVCPLCCKFWCCCCCRWIRDQHWHYTC